MQITGTPSRAYNANGVVWSDKEQWEVGLDQGIKLEMWTALVFEAVWWLGMV